MSVRTVNLPASAGAGGVNPPHQREQQQEAERGTGQPPAVVPAPTIKNGTEAQHYQADCTKPRDGEEAQLCAEVRSASAAERATDLAQDANWISSAAALLAFVSVILVLIALWQNKKANIISAKGYAKSRIEARQTANVNARVAEVAEKAMMIGQRARLTVQQVQVGHGRDDSGKMALGYEVAWKNTGQTEALNARLFTQHMLVRANEAPNLSYDEADGPGGASVIGPDRMVYSMTGAVLVEDLEAVWNGQKRLIVHSVMEYSDIFAAEYNTPRRRTVYVGEADLPGPPSLLGTDVPYFVNFRSDLAGNEAS